MALDPITAILNIGGQVIDRLWPDPAKADEAKLELMKLAQAGELAQLTADTQIITGQLEVNKADAQSGSFWQAGWRPAFGWAAAFVFFWTYVVYPFAKAAIVIWKPEYKDIVPALDLDGLWVVATGMLGIGGYRSIEKIKGLAK